MANGVHDLTDSELHLPHKSDPSSGSIRILQ